MPFASTPRPPKLRRASSCLAATLCEQRVDDLHCQPRVLGYLGISPCYDMKLQTENIYQVIELPAPPAKVFDALLDQDAHVAFTGKDALIQPTRAELSRCATRTIPGTFCTSSKTSALFWLGRTRNSPPVTSPL